MLLVTSFVLTIFRFVYFDILPLAVEGCVYLLDRFVICHNHIVICKAVHEVDAANILIYVNLAKFCVR